MLLPFWSLQDRIGMDWVTPAAFALAVALAAAFLFVPRRFALVLPLLVLGLWVAAVRPIWFGKHGLERASLGYLFQGIRNADRDWVDRTLPDGAQAAFLWTGRTDRLTVNQTEFFNRAVGPVYYLQSPTPGGLPEKQVNVDPDTGRVTFPGGEDVADEYLLADSSFEPDGKILGERQGLGRQPLARQPPARLGREGRRPLPERHVVGRDGHVHATPMPARSRVGRGVERSEPLPRAADGRRSLERTPSSGRVTFEPDERRQALGPRRAGRGDRGVPRRSTRSSTRRSRRR